MDDLYGKDAKRFIAAMMVFGLTGFVMIVCGFRKQIQTKNIDAQIDNYAASLPNWDDSIRLAATDEELQAAIANREQAKLKIAHFSDSLREIVYE